jgi:hypothetical protein
MKRSAIALGLVLATAVAGVWASEGYNKPPGTEAEISKKNFTLTVTTRLSNQSFGPMLEVLGDRLQATGVAESNARKKGAAPATAFSEIFCGDGVLPRKNVTAAGLCTGDPAATIPICTCVDAPGCKVNASALELEFCVFGLLEPDLEDSVAAGGLGVGVAFDADSTDALGADFPSGGDIFSVFRAQLIPE